MKVVSKDRVEGVMDECVKLGVSYNHVYMTLRGTRHCPALVLKINKLSPSLFKAPYCCIDYKEIIKSESNNYYWHSSKKKFIRIRR